MNLLTNTFIVAFLVVLASIVMYYNYTGILPGSKLIVQEPPISGDTVDNLHAKFMFFYTTWCPYSQQAQDPWRSFKQSLQTNSKTYGGKTVIFEEIDCDRNLSKAGIYLVKAYPTFKLQTESKVYEMIGKPTPANFRAFLIAALGQESS
jgi:thiol-disulfide isomerase/thioredoxin